MCDGSADARCLGPAWPVASPGSLPEHGPVPVLPVVPLPNCPPDLRPSPAAGAWPRCPADRASLSSPPRDGVAPTAPAGCAADAESLAWPEPPPAPASATSAATAPAITMRSPSRNWPAPVVMTSVPRSDRRRLRRDRPAPLPTCTARKTAVSLSGWNTPRRPPRSTSAFAGTTSASFFVSSVMPTRAYIPGFRRVRRGWQSRSQWAPCVSPGRGSGKRAQCGL